MKIAHTDVMEWCRTYDGPKFHALLCDPPYELGFMGKDWDASGIAFCPETWAALAEHLHPGAFGVAFASSRGWHRLACAIEDSGLRTHPSIFGWSFGSGFPKATRVNGSKAFDGHRYGLQALKPALEPVIVFQKKYEGKPVECIVRTGAGALWIDGGKRGTEVLPECRAGQARIGTFEREDMVTPERQGRWPANFYLGDEEAAKRLGEQSGESTSLANKITDNRHVSFYQAGDSSSGGYSGERNPENSHNDTGTASRFFFNVNRQLDEADPVMYCAKASRKERDAGLEEFDKSHPIGGADKWTEQDRRKGDGVTRNPSANVHPCCKPLDLCRWLATLLLPPAEYAPRRILIPFAGSGSNALGHTSPDGKRLSALRWRKSMLRLLRRGLNIGVTYQSKCLLCS